MFCLLFKTDAQITLYGSLLFECYLKETSMIDIDVQFKETLPYETLKELLKIVRNWGRQ
jgi:tRNA nucleotidyltransferase (CCA-adding enzyme)